MNTHERRIRAHMNWALAERNALNDRIFNEGRNPTPDEWREIQGFNRIYTNCCEMLAKFFPPKHPPDPEYKEVLY